MIYTLGYNDPVVTAPRLRSLLSVEKRLLVDVRLKPYSPHPLWKRHKLEQMLGSGYLWIGEFGNLDYRGTGIRLAAPEKGLERIMPYIGQGYDLFLMCACANHQTCHRHTVSQFISHELGLVVEHLHGASFVRYVGETAPPQQLSLL